MRVSLKDVKIELKTRLFKVNIQILLEGLMFIIKCWTWFIERFNWLFVRLEPSKGSYEYLNHNLKVYS